MHRPTGILRVLAAVAMGAALSGCGPQPQPEQAAPTASGAMPGPSQGGAADCTIPPDPAAFRVGTSHPCFGPMSQRFGTWLGANTEPDGTETTPSSEYTADTQTNIENVRRIMGGAPQGWLDSGQWTRLLNEPPPPITQLRSNGIGPLWFGMTGAQLDASGFGRTVTDPRFPPTADIVGARATGCYDGETFYGVIVKDGSAVRTVEGISTASTLTDLQAAFGDRLQTRQPPAFPDWVAYTVDDGDYGYAFIPQYDGSMMLLAADIDEVARADGPHGVCGY